MIAIVGSDGTRPVVWGVGATVAEARQDAQRWLGEAFAGHEAADMAAHEITEAQAALVGQGRVPWPLPSPAELAGAEDAETWIQELGDACDLATLRAAVAPGTLGADEALINSIGSDKAAEVLGAPLAYDEADEYTTESRKRFMAACGAYSAAWRERVEDEIARLEAST